MNKDEKESPDWALILLGTIYIVVIVAFVVVMFVVFGQVDAVASSLWNLMPLVVAILSIKIMLGLVLYGGHRNVRISRERVRNSEKGF